MTDPGAPAAQVLARLGRELPPELAEVLLPVLRLRASGGRLYAVLPNRMWLDAFALGAQEACASAAAACGLSLTAAAREDARIEAPSGGFDSVIEDPGNRLALAAARRVVREPGLAHNPLYLHGPPGTGKSHLLAALVQEAAAAAGDDGALLVTGEDFVSRWAHALAGREAHPLQTAVAGAAVLACDGIEALAGRLLAQEQLFLLLNAALDRGQQVVVSGREPPHRLAGFEERLSTRLGWGLTVAVEPPLLETRLALLRRLSPASVEIEAAELAALAERWGSDLHGIADLAARIERGERPGADSEEASFDRIMRAVAEAFGVRPGDITGPGQARQVVRARQAALLLGRRLTGHGLVALGGMVGGRDHSTVLYSIRRAEARLASDADFARRIAELGHAVRG